MLENYAWQSKINNAQTKRTYVENSAEKDAQRSTRKEAQKEKHMRESTSTCGKENKEKQAWRI